jgi:hypothetical protein
MTLLLHALTLAAFAFGHWANTAHACTPCHAKQVLADVEVTPQPATAEAAADSSPNDNDGGSDSPQGATR